MNGLEITRKVRVKCTLTADDWELYTSNPDSRVAAQLMNRVFQEAVNFGHSRKGVQEAVWRLMRNWKETGATDSEPMRKLERMLDEVFGRETAP